MKHGAQSNYLMDVPEGFELLDRGSPFLAMVGPLYCKRNDDGTPVFGLRVGPQHANVKGMVGERRILRASGVFASSSGQRR